MRLKVSIDRIRLAEFCRRNRIRRLAVLHTPTSLSRYFRDHVLSEAEDQYRGGGAVRI